MDLETYDEIMECMPRGRTRFFYFKDRYALLLLRHASRFARTKSDLQRTAFARLLSKPAVKEALARRGGGDLCPELFDTAWPDEYQCYLLTLTGWKSCVKSTAQMSRYGYNLVLQLNFCSQHDEAYRELIRPGEHHPFEYRWHPISEGKLRTLAWARLDVDLDSGQALIEEIQTDWVRRALQAREMAAKSRYGIRFRRGHSVGKKNILRYVDEVLAPHIKCWDEAMLAASIWFLREELGLRHIFYHTFESGAELKQIRWGQHVGGLGDSRRFQSLHL